MLDFFSKLFDTQGFMPHGHCYLWEPGPFWLTVISDTMIVIAYFSIPILLLKFSRRRPDLKLQHIFALFAAFILLCGCSHLLAIVSMWKPFYRLEGIVLFLTGIVSILTAVKVAQLFPTLISIPTPSQYRKTQATLHQAQKASEEAVQASALKSRFLANASHELRTPLNGIVGTLELLQMEKRNDDDKELLDIAKQSADLLLLLINDVLDLSKIEAGHLQLTEDTFELSNVVEETAKILSPIAHEKGIQLRTVADHTLSVVAKGDRTRIMQILVNLTANAIKFTKEGYVELACRPKEVDREHLMIEFQIKDTGIGISSEKLESVFEAFSQETSDTQHTYGGTGLGLTISKQLAMAMGGDIAVSSKLGEGSCFTVTLQVTPVTGSEEEVFRDIASKPSSPTDLSLPSTRARKVLLVEDLHNNQLIVRKILGKRGHIVDFAETCKQALKLSAEHDYDVILMDIRLPDGSGFDVARKIRDRKQQNPPAIIGLSAQTLPEDLAQAQSVGMAHYLKKPVFSQELISIVEEF